MTFPKNNLLEQLPHKKILLMSFGFLLILGHLFPAFTCLYPELLTKNGPRQKFLRYFPKRTLGILIVSVTIVSGIAAVLHPLTPQMMALPESLKILLPPGHYPLAAYSELDAKINFLEGFDRLVSGIISIPVTVLILKIYNSENTIRSQKPDLYLLALAIILNCWIWLCVHQYTATHHTQTKNITWTLENSIALSNPQTASDTLKKIIKSSGLTPSYTLTPPNPGSKTGLILRTLTKHET